ncbi:MAG: general secretion pathway protein GspK [Gammaproteobacteria bacterium]
MKTLEGQEVVYSDHKNEQKGIALVIVLWMLALLSIIALAYSGMTRSENQLTSNVARSAKARAIAEAGLWTAVHDLLRAPNDRRFSPDGTVVVLPIENKYKALVSSQDESGKVDLNKASLELLLGMIKSTELDHEQSLHLVEAILDWRDKDNLQRVNGAETAVYEELDLPYGAKNGTFNSVEELMLVKGMTEEIFDQIKSGLTVHSMQARVRLSASPEGVLRGLPGMDESLVADMIAGRSNDATAIISVIPDITRPYIFASGRGNIFTIVSNAKVEDVIAKLKVTLILKKTGNKPITILDWKEVAPTLTVFSEQDNLTDNVSL